MSEQSPFKKKVYFLGAGASNDEFELPTMQGFFRSKDICREEYSQLKAFVDINFPEIPLQQINLEDVITYLELSLDRFGSFGKRPGGKFLDAREQFDQFVQERLELPEGKRFCPRNRLNRIFQGLRDQDSIISLNYDLVVERTLGRIRDQLNNDRLTTLYYLLTDTTSAKFSQLRGNEMYGLFIKLHGSLDWFRCPNSNCSDYPRMIHRENTNEPMVCGACGADLEVAIVPPAMSKSFDRWPKLGLMWRLAREELAAATGVVFIGVSFAPSDYYLRWLIKSSFLESGRKKESIEVVDRCPSVKERIREMVNMEPRHYPSVKEYIKEV